MQWFQMEQTKVSPMYYIVERFQCFCGFRKYLKYLLIKNLCNLKLSTFIFLKIPPISTGTFEAFVTLSFQHHGLHRK